MKTRVLHVITSLSLGGAQMALYRLLSAMNRDRFDPVVVSLAGDGPMGQRIGRLGIPVHTMNARLGMTGPLAFWRFVRLVRHHDADLIQGWQYHGSVAAQLSQMIYWRPVPVLWNIRHCIHDLRHEKRTTAAVVKLGARLSHRAERVIYVAQTSAAQHEALGYQADRRLILPNGFDTDRLAPRPDARARLRRELRLPDTTLLIGKVARYHPMKDHANFLDAARDLAQSHPDVHFVLAGEDVDAANADLMQLINRLELGARTHLLGRRDDADDILAALDIATLASYTEAFPNVIGEAMACGVPCVATDVGDCALIVGNSGRVVPPRQPRALSQAWAWLIDMGFDHRMALGLIARRRIVEHYGLSSVVARYEQLYEELAQRRFEGTGHQTETSGMPPEDALSVRRRGPCLD